LPVLAVCLATAGGLVMPSRSAALGVSVTLGTSALSGQGGLLAFDLFGLDGADGNNRVRIQSLITDGLLGPALTVGDVTGSLPGPVDVTEAAGFGELLQAIRFGDEIRLLLDATTAFASSDGQADRFGLFLLDPVTSLSMVDTDLDGDALFTVDFVGGARGIGLTLASATTPAVPVTGTVVRAPAPETWALLAGGLPLVAWRHLRRKHRGTTNPQQESAR
jgi:hypothetical protein